MRTTAVGLALTAVLLGHGPALAHGADGPVYQQVNGPYLVSVYDGRETDQPGKAEYRLVLTRDPGDGRLGEGAPVVPVPGARVTVRDEAGRTHTATGIGSVYSMVLDDKEQDLAITITAPPGTTAVTVSVHALQEPAEGTSSAAAVAGIATACAVAVAGTVVLLRRRAQVGSGVGWSDRR